MDFTLPYTDEQQRFRQEVRTWLEANIPANMRDPFDSNDFTEGMYKWWREKHKEIAKKGWLYPTYPKEYGGGGLTGDHETIIEEEFTRARVVRGMASGLLLTTLLVWATEEQKRRFLPPFLTAEKVTWQKLTEPQSGTDLANYQSRAVRDGDDWLLTGNNVFISGRGDHPDYLFGPMLTDTEAPRHRNLGYFIIPVPAPGLDIRQQNLVGGHDQHFIFMDNVRVPGDHLIGGDHQGWQVLGTHLEQEHGGRGQAFPRDEVVDNMLTFLREGERRGEARGSDPVIQQVAMEGYIDGHVNALLQKRTYWMYQAHMEIVWEGIIGNVFGREKSGRNADRVREVMGPAAQLGAKDPLAPFGGQPDVYQRTTFGTLHAGGSLNIAKVTAARRIGISRTKERPAPTPSTAGRGGA